MSSTTGLGAFGFLRISSDKPLGAGLGGGINGHMPRPIIIHDNSDFFARTRFTLRDAWNTGDRTGSSYPRRIITPFRAVNNAGDLLARQNYACGGSCQTQQSRPGLHGLREKFGSTSNGCTADVFYNITQVNPAIPSSTCNGKFVYDSSDYIRFRKNQAINRNYNDRSFGGDQSNATQHAIQAIRR